MKKSLLYSAIVFSTLFACSDPSTEDVGTETLKVHPVDNSGGGPNMDHCPNGSAYTESCLLQSSTDITHCPCKCNGQFGRYFRWSLRAGYFACYQR